MFLVFSFSPRANSASTILSSRIGWNGIPSDSPSDSMAQVLLKAMGVRTVRASITGMEFSV